MRGDTPKNTVTVPSSFTRILPLSQPLQWIWNIPSNALGANPMISTFDVRPKPRGPDYSRHGHPERDKPRASPERLSW